MFLLRPGPYKIKNNNNKIKYTEIKIINKNTRPLKL